MKSSFNHRPRKQVKKHCKNPEGYKYKVKQSFKDECDINRIMKKYQETGMINHLDQNQGVYNELFTAPTSAYDAIERVERAQAAFGTLPSHIRDAFKNDPGVFYNFATDPANKEQMIKMGLAKRWATEEPSQEASAKPQNDQPPGAVQDEKTPEA